jgi:RNase H-fold protein (predicted Holliday junction resolvase)
MAKKINKKALESLCLENSQENLFTAKPSIAIDFGEKKCGIVGSSNGLCAVSLGIIETAKIFDFTIKYCQGKKISTIILGLPLSSSGEENELCLEIKKLGKKFSRENFTIHFHNERYTSAICKSYVSGGKNYDDLSALRIWDGFWRSQFL